jgi:hypothetical protein
MASAKVLLQQALVLLNTESSEGGLCHDSVKLEKATPLQRLAASSIQEAFGSLASALQQIPVVEGTLALARLDGRTVPLQGVLDRLRECPRHFRAPERMRGSANPPAFLPASVASWTAGGVPATEASVSFAAAHELRTLLFLACALERTGFRARITFGGGEQIDLVVVEDGSEE